MAFCRVQVNLLRTKSGEYSELLKMHTLIILNEKFYLQNSSRKQGRRIPYLAFMGALMINCYATEPRFSVPYEIIKNLVDMDELLAKWRCKHSSD